MAAQRARTRQMELLSILVEYKYALSSSMAARVANEKTILARLASRRAPLVVGSEATSRVSKKMTSPPVTK